MNRCLCTLALLLAATCAPRGEQVTVHKTRRVVQIIRDGEPEVMNSTCPPEACTQVSLQGFVCHRFSERPDTVVVSGHSSPPSYLGEPPEALADALACLRPELVVLDTCYGLSAPLLDELVRHGFTPMLAGVARKLPPEGLDYSPGFFGDVPVEQRIRLVRPRTGPPLRVFRLDPAALRMARATVDGWSVEKLLTHLERKLPNLVRVELPGTTAEILFLASPTRFRPKIQP